MYRQLTIISLFICNCCLAQNLVPNPDFETFSACPDAYSQINLATPWFTPSDGSPDYFNSCGNIEFNVPDNTIGYQNAHSGTAYCGIYLWSTLDNGSPDIREYIEAPLISTLIRDQCYNFQMFVNLGNYCNYTTHNIGVYFSDTSISGINHFHALPFIPQIINPSTVSFDTLNWTLVSGEYKAKGTEKYIIIGNFNEYEATDTVLISNAGYDAAYCLIDDISLTAKTCTPIVIDTPIVIAIDSTCRLDLQTKIYSNPFTHTLVVEKNATVCKVAMNVYNILGQLIIKNKMINDGHNEIQLSNFSGGIYFYQFISDGKIKLTGNFFKP